MKRHIHILLLLLALSIPCVAQQMIGVPFFRNFTAREYNAHNRNFDILCDENGHTFVANFEGLLIYDNVNWRIVHTPGISRVTDVSFDKKGTLWFAGVNVKGYVEYVDGDTIKVKYIQSDKNETGFQHERSTEGEADRWNDIVVLDRLVLSPRFTLLATATAGVIAIDENEEKIWEINEQNGLCSNSITKLAYDGKGSVWGATDNGLFRISVSEIYSHYSEHEGLTGQVSSITIIDDKFFVGTLQGMFRFEEGKFVKVEGIDQACWQLATTVRKNALAATSNGVFTYGHSIHRLSKQISLSVVVENDDTFLSGELDGIYRRGYDGYAQKLDDISNTIRMEKDKRGGIWALTLGGEYYYLAPGGKHFKKQKEGPLSLLFEYKDPTGRKWRCHDDGRGLICDDMPRDFMMWFEPFANYNIQAMLIDLKDKEVAWIGGNFGLVRIDLKKTLTQKPLPPQIHIRSFSLNKRSLTITIANAQSYPVGGPRYSYRLHTKDAWSAWDDDQKIDFQNLAYGRYQLAVRSIDPYGQISESDEREFNIPYPIYMRWYAILFYFLLMGLGIYAFFKNRTRQMEKRQEKLEKIVKERTQEVISQKDEIEVQKNEIEEKSKRLETTLAELRQAQKQLVRKEREATIGKLTQGLIDRILNPMNYINNFSHLSIGLTNDLRENLKDGEQNMTSDIYDDSMDVLDMMRTNLEKIEQHGLSTTRILKAMEEMLKERPDKIDSIDLGMLCQQDIEMLHKYYEKEISSLAIQVEWEKPKQPVIVDANAELISKTIMSMLGNSIYALQKKADRNSKDTLILRLSIQPAHDGKKPTISIYDNGIGIEENIISKVFDPFFTTKPTAEAPGVGLYLSQQIIQDFGGNITVHSEKDKYTEFTISF